MSITSWMQIGVTLLIIFLLSMPVGRYLAAVVMEQRMLFDPFFDRIDNAIYLLIGRRAASMPMNWRAYTLHMLVTNLVMAVIIYLILVFQDRLPLNPKNFPAMEPMLAFNTAISFITNTDWQSYAGETTLSNFSQMAAITFPMCTSATTVLSSRWPLSGPSSSRTAAPISAISITIWSALRRACCCQSA